MADKRRHEDSLERFFQKKAGEYDIPYREEDWQKLEKQLDIRDLQMAHRRKMSWIAAAAVLILSVLGFFTYQNHNRLNDISQQINETPVPGDDLLPDAGELLTENENERNEGEAERSESAVDSGFAREADTGISGEQNETGEAEQETETGIENPERMDIPGARENESRDRLIHVPRPEFEAPYEDYIAEADIGNRTFQIRHTAQRRVWTDVAETGEERQPYIAGTFTDTQIRPSASRWAAGVMLSPDLSAVGSFSNFYDPGYKIGVSVEYKFGENFAVAAGLAQSMVRYTASGDEYNPSVYWQDGISPEKTFAECLILDIPVSLKYDFLHPNHRSRFFAGVSLSSYIMLNEEYRFRYENPDSGLREGWNGKTGTRHWMSNAGFSIGYELDIHPNWSLRAEPFVKMPLKEVGWGNVRLYSVGSFFSLHFRL